MQDRKLARLLRTAEIADALQCLSESAVVAWFNATERQIIDDVLTAQTDDERREAAAYARAFRDVRTFLYSTISEGDRAKTELRNSND